MKGFQQAPGVDKNKSFSPVACSSTIAILLSTTLHMEDQGWTSEIFDVEAVFLNAELEKPMYLEWPKPMRELGFITKEREEEKYIKLVRSMYGNVDAALSWQKTFINLCTNKEIKCVQTNIDPCMLYKKDEKRKLRLIISVYVDDVLISGREIDIREFKETCKKTYKITDLGQLKRVT